MGSSGTDRFRDYPPQNQGNEADPQGGDQPASAETDPCQAPGGEIALEEVGRSDYLSTHDNVPEAGSNVQVSGIREGRIVVTVTETGESVGYLPIAYNYLAGCLETHNYAGEVAGGTMSPQPTVLVVLSDS